MRRRIAVLAGVALLALAAAAAQADVFNMPTGQTSLLFVPVGTPGNTADPFEVRGQAFGGAGCADW